MGRSFLGRRAVALAAVVAAGAAPRPADACYQSFNNVSGLTVTKLSVDDASRYTIQGNALTLGTGGLVGTTTATTFRQGAPYMYTPITLGAAQTWSVDGKNVNGQ